MNEHVDVWAERTLERIGVPLDAWAVLATLEAEGLRDEDARARFARPDLRAFAADVFALAVARRRTVAPLRRAERPKATPLATAASAAARGGPLAVQLAATALTGHSLFTSSALSGRHCLLLNIGTLTSGIAAGAASAAMSARAATPLALGSARDLRYAMQSSVALSAAISLGVLASSAAAWLLADVGGLREFLRFATGHLALSAFWTSLAAMLTIRKWAVATALSAAGAACVAALHYLGASPAAAVLAGDLLFAGAGAGTVEAHLRRLAAAEVDGAAPPRSVVALELGARLPDLIYGAAYVALLLCDRVVVWTSDVARSQIAAYEHQVNFALLAAAAPLAAAEACAESFAVGSEGDAATHTILAIGAFRRSAEARLAAQVRRLLAVSVASTLAAAIAARLMRQHLSWVAALAALGHALLALGAFGALLHQQHARPSIPARTLGAAVLITGIFGYTAARAGGAGWAVTGFVCGSAYFCAQMLRRSSAMLRELDHARHASF